jgi:hypothetical protein
MLLLKEDSLFVRRVSDVSALDAVSAQVAEVAGPDEIDEVNGNARLALFPRG